MSLPKKHGYSYNGEVLVSGTYKDRVRVRYLYGTHRSVPISIWHIWDDGYNKNLSTFEKFINIFLFFIIFQLSLSHLLKIVETVNKRSKSLKLDDSNSLIILRYRYTKFSKYIIFRTNTGAVPVYLFA
jgi:hypothetical protein